jgi:hypothetical protein
LFWVRAVNYYCIFFERVINNAPPSINKAPVIIFQFNCSFRNTTERIIANTSDNRSIEETNAASPSFRALNWNNDDKQVIIPAEIRYIHEPWSIFPNSPDFLWKNTHPHDIDNIKTACIAKARPGSTFFRPALESTMAQAALRAAIKENTIHMRNFVIRLQTMSHPIVFVIYCSHFLFASQRVAL